MVSRDAFIKRSGTHSDEEARAVPARDLPTYTVMVAAYQEANVIAETIRALEALEYPRDRLELRLLLEEDDRATIDAARASQHGPSLEVIEVPSALPKPDERPQPATQSKVVSIDAFRKK